MSNVVSRPRAGRESGFALLFVLLMASIIAIMLYQAMPRAAFEGQRLKEDLLIERGEQYKRAIQLYLRKLGRYPTTIDQLEDTNNTRFLRHRYVDPMTGKDEWRLIHVGPGGVFLDSLTQKPPPVQGVNNSSGFASGFGQQRSGAGQTSSAFGPSVAGFGQASSGFGQTSSGFGQTGSASTNSGAPADPDDALPVPLRFDQRRRESDGPVPVPGDTLDNNLQAGAAQPSAERIPASQAAQTELPGAGQTPQQGFQSAQQGIQSAQQGQSTPGDSGQPQSASSGNSVIQGIMNGLRSGSPQLAQAGQGGIGGTSQIGGGGIAGVASKSLYGSIKVYNDQKKYKKWEFLYDPNKDFSKQIAAAAAGLPTGPTMGSGVPGMNSQQMGTSPFSSGMQSGAGPFSGMQPGGNSPSPQATPQPSPQPAPQSQ